MFNKTSLQDWETVVRQQLKTDDIYAVLSKENLEGIVVLPYYDAVSVPLPNLPRIEESTQLVARYNEDLEADVFAFLLDQNVENLSEKVLFINNKDLAEHIATDEANRYLSLIDIFAEDQTGEIYGQLGRELLAKNFERNICIDVSLHQNAGASIIQQLAYALAKTMDLTDILGAEILNKLVFRFASGSSYFFELAKVRAFKLLFNQLSKEFKTDTWPYIFVETTFRNKTKNDPENNLIRSTLELSAAMAGGADAVFSHDFRIGHETPLSEEIAFKQQIVLAYESIINVFEDAGNGSYYIENITQQFAEKAWKTFLSIEERGGYAAALKSGTIQRSIYENAVRQQNWLAEGRTKLVGANLYPALEQTKSTGDLYDPMFIRPVRLAEMFE